MGDMKRLPTLPILLFAIATVSSLGCIWERQYNPTGKDTFIGIPDVFEWTVYENYPSMPASKDSNEFDSKLEGNDQFD